MVSCCQCGPSAGGATVSFVELQPCSHALCARCYHSVTASGSLGVLCCPCCLCEANASTFIQCDNAGNVVEKGEEIQHPPLILQVVYYVHRRARGALITIINTIIHYVLDPRLIWNALMNLTPAKNPLLWVIINAFVVFYSLYLLLLVANYAADEGHKALRLADQSYLVYDFATTIIWVVETFLGVATIVGQGRKDACWKISIPASLLHFVVSIFFLWDSFTTLDKWKWRKEDIVVDTFWVLMNLMAYTVVLAETLYHFIKTVWRRRTYSQVLEEEEANKNSDIIYHDALLARVLPYYDRAQRTMEHRPVKSLKTEDFTKLFVTAGDDLVELIPDI